MKQKATASEIANAEMEVQNAQKQIDLVTTEYLGKQREISAELKNQLLSLGFTEQQIIAISEKLEQVKTIQNEAKTASQDWGKTLEDGFKQATDAMGNAISGLIQDGEFKFEEFAKSILDIFSNIASQILQTGLTSVLGGGLS